MPGETVQERLTENLFARRADRWTVGAIAAFLVALGFIAGRWTSPTSNATPIVFQEAPERASAEVTEEDLDALVAGTETDASRAAPARGRAPSSAAEESEESSAEPSEASSLGAFVASVNGKKYYFPDCAEVKRIKEENIIWFDSEDEATESGYEPSACNLKRQQ